jgi:aspartate aminotransferase-like enzyme
MEAVARQFATNEHVMVIRNGWFSFRWTEIFEMGDIPKSHTVLKAQPQPGDDPAHVQYAPYPVDDVVAKIYEERPKAIFCAHVETSTGMIVPDDYIRKVSAAIHDVGGIFVLDCIASGTVWADMKDLGVDVVISAPQKGWTGPCCAALVMMSDRAAEKLQTTKETSFSMSLKRWSAIMDTYTAGGFGYHTTMPTDGLRDFHEISVETLKFGLPELKKAQYQLGKTARDALDERGLVSVAAPGFQAPGVLVYYSPSDTANPDMMSKFKAGGLQSKYPSHIQMCRFDSFKVHACRNRQTCDLTIPFLFRFIFPCYTAVAMGVPWRIDEPDGLKTFRIGLFGLDKMGDIQGTVDTLTAALDPILVETSHAVAADKKVA